MATTDPFTEDAITEAHERYSTAGNREVWMDATKWAQRYLAAQEPTDAECAAVLDVKYGGSVGPYDEPYDAEDMAEARAALSAARAARRDEEKRDG